MSSPQIIIDYYSDILCVWAWISQRRIDELNKQFGHKIELRCHFVDVFGDTSTRIQEQWSNNGLYDGFGKHVIKAAAPYESAIVNSDVWLQTRPTTSANAHMVIKAVEIVYGCQYAIDFALALRKAFFVDAKDISQLEVIYVLASTTGITVDPIISSISDGRAIAALMHDYQVAKDNGIKGSPCFVMNEGRQVLFGNVGYRVLHTNIEEMLNNPENDASWC